MVGCKFVMSLLLDADLRQVDPVVAGVNHLPLVTEMRIGDRDGFAELRALLEDQDKQREPVWMTPPEGMHYRKVSDGAEWTKADVIGGNAVKLELFRRFGVLPGASDVHVVEFFAGFQDVDIFHYRLDGHMADKADDDAYVEALLASDEITTFPSGELVAELISSILTNEPVALPVNLPNTGQVQNLADDVIVECIGMADGNTVVPRDSVAVPSILGEQLRRVVAAEEFTVEAGITGDRTKALEAMLADPVAGALPYDQVVQMTDELLAATSKWLPQFSQ
jgi:alpha-galactosidase/6-phospho-beta-glucosidase family protein